MLQSNIQLYATKQRYIQCCVQLLCTQQLYTAVHSCVQLCATKQQYSNNVTGDWTAQASEVPASGGRIAAEGRAELGAARRMAAMASDLAAAKLLAAAGAVWRLEQGRDIVS